MKRIMVATDGSESASRAVDFAAHEAKAHDAELLITHIVGGYGLPGNLLTKLSPGQHEWLRETLTSLAAATLEAARERARALGISAIRLESREDDVAPGLLDVAREAQADVLVVGKRGAGRAAGLLLGSVSQKLVSLAAIPVIVVP